MLNNILFSHKKEKSRRKEEIGGERERKLEKAGERRRKREKEGERGRGMHNPILLLMKGEE